METNFEDIDGKCIVCGTLFIWTVGEQEFMQNLKNNNLVKFIVPPKRCPDCRQKKREEENNVPEQ